jgi:hypothetical protein
VPLISPSLARRAYAVYVRQDRCVVRASRGPAGACPAAQPRVRSCRTLHRERRWSCSPLDGEATLTLDDPGATRVTLSAGEVVLLAHGSGHLMQDRGSSPARPLDHILAEEVSGQAGRLTYGGGGPRTSLLCGGFGLASGLPEDLLGLLPPLLVLDAAGTGGGPWTRWLEPAFLLMRSEGARGAPGATAVMAVVHSGRTAPPCYGRDTRCHCSWTTTTTSSSPPKPSRRSPGGRGTAPPTSSACGRSSSTTTPTARSTACWRARTSRPSGTTTRRWASRAATCTQ